TTADVVAQAGTRTIDLRATGQVIRFDGFLKLYQEGRDDEEDEEGGRLPAMAKGDALAKDKIAADQHFTEPPPAFDLCFDPRGFARARLRSPRQEAAHPRRQRPSRDGFSGKFFHPLRRL